MAFSTRGSSNTRRNNSGGDTRDGGLRQWLHNQNFIQDKACDPRNTTHLLMTGGKICIPDDQYNTFLGYYAEDLSHKSASLWWSIHENATRYSRVYFDFDIAEWAAFEGEELHKDVIEKFVRMLQTSVLSHFPSVHTRLHGIENKLDRKGLCIVLAAPTAFTQKINDTLKKPVYQWRRKTGLHIIFPYLYADLNQLLQLRAAAIDALDRCRHIFLPPDNANSWDTVIDIGVYTGNAGLRMPGSDKFDSCDACIRKRSAMCSVCNGRERVRVERAYWPILSLDSTGLVSKQAAALRDDPLKMLQLCTIRKPYQYYNDPEFKVPTGAAVYNDSPIVYTVDTQYILDNLPAPPPARNAKQQAIAAASSGGALLRASSGVGQHASGASATPGAAVAAAATADDASDNGVQERVLSPGTSWSLAAREGRGSKRSAASQVTNPLTGGKLREAMSAGARSDFAASRELQRFGAEHLFAVVFQTFLRGCGKKWPQYKSICVTHVRRSIPNSFRAVQHRAKRANRGGDDDYDALRERQILSEMTVIDDPRPCVYMIGVRGEGCRYCHSEGREHKKSQIYFYANADGIMQRCFCKKYNCPDYSSPPIHWNDYEYGFIVMKTFFGYKTHGAIDQPTRSGTLPTIMLPEGSSRSAHFSTHALVQHWVDKEKGAAASAATGNDVALSAAEKLRIAREQDAEIDAFAAAPSSSLSAKKGRTSYSAATADSMMTIDDEKGGGVPTDVMERILNANHFGVYLPPLSARGGILPGTGTELCVPSMPTPTSLAQAENVAFAVMQKNASGQRQRIERFTGGLPRRDEIAPELRSRLAPTSQSAYEMRSPMTPDSSTVVVVKKEPSDQ